MQKYYQKNGLKVKVILSAWFFDERSFIRKFYYFFLSHAFSTNKRIIALFKRIATAHCEGCLAPREFGGVLVSSMRG